ncbi:MAG: glycosyltransferase [Roseicyclus sp.]|uniref:glycosyltransferase n=1 Tax=Roseicyclus sp. TaxID=1914329 RepID=UPI003A8858F6
MRVLYVSVDLFYTNPTGRLLSAVIDHISDVKFFGPGFVSTEELSSGLNSFVDRNGPFDIVLATEKVALIDPNADFSSEIERYKRLYYFNFPESDLRFLPQIASDYRLLKIPRVLSLLQNDLYNWNNSHADMILASADVILSNGLENVVYVDEMQNRSSEPWAMGATDVFVGLVKEYPSRFASFPLFVSDSEVCRVPHVFRPNRWAVPGVRYRARRIAAEKLALSGHKLSRRPPGSYIHKAAEMIGRMPYSGIAAAQYFFRREMENARAVYTCGSVLRQPIRKFFEIPAAGALLVCEPCAGLSDYGFEHDSSCLIISPEDILEADQFLNDHSERAQDIARRAQKLVIAKHSTLARSVQLAAVFKRLLAGTFAGARWSNGEYVLLGTPDLRVGTSYSPAA